MVEYLPVSLIGSKSLCPDKTITGNFLYSSLTWAASHCFLFINNFTEGLKMSPFSLFINGYNISVDNHVH